MKTNLPEISIIIPTLNCERNLEVCLESITKQDYPFENIEIIIIDGGSTDATLDVAKKHDAKIIVRPDLKHDQERRKGVGMENSSKELLAFIDSDNILPNLEWLKSMVGPLVENNEIIATEPLRYHYSSSFSLINRYFALVGYNDPVAGYLKKADRLAWDTDEWDLYGQVEDRGYYFLVKFTPDEIPTLGGNGYIVRREVLLESKCRLESFFHIDINTDLIENGYDTYAFVKTSIIHLTGNTFFSYIKKRMQYMEKYYFDEQHKRRYHIYSKKENLKLIKYIIFSVTLIEPFLRATRGYLKVNDIAWFLHPPICFSITVIYGYTTFKRGANTLIRALAIKEADK